MIILKSQFDTKSFSVAMLMRVCLLSYLLYSIM